MNFKYVLPAVNFTKTIVVLLFSIVLILPGCKKDKAITSDTPANSSYYNSLADFFSKNEVKSKFLAYSPSALISETDSDGVNLTIPYDAFVDANGTTPGAAINVEFKKILTLKDMVLSNMQTTSNSTILETDAQIFLKVTAGGSLLNLCNNSTSHKKISIHIPTDSDIPGLAVYFENPATPETDWTASSLPVVPFISRNFVLTVDFLNNSWMQCAKINSGLLMVNMDIHLKINLEETEPFETVVFAVFPGIRTVIKPPAISADGLSYHASNIPSGISGKLIAIGIGTKSKKLVVGSADISVSSAPAADMQLNPMMDEQLDTLLKQL